MVGITQDTDFLKGRTQQMLEETQEGKRSWITRGASRASTIYNVDIPEDGENYKVLMSLMKFGSNGDTRYLLVSHETGFFANDYKLRSVDCSELSELGRLVFPDNL